MRYATLMLLCATVVAQVDPIVYLGPDPDVPQPSMAGTALFMIDAGAEEQGKLLDSIYAAYDHGPRLRWLTKARRAVVVSQDVVQEERFGMGCFPDLWILSLDGLPSRKLTRHRGTAGFAPSPDGERIAYSVPNHGFWLVDVKTGRSTTPRGMRFKKAWDPVWTPDGGRVLFRGWQKTSDYGTWSVAADGTDARRLGDTVSYPTFLDEGTLLALEYTWPPAPKKLLQLRVDGWKTTTLAEGLTSKERPVVSPDKKHVVFVRAQDGVMVVLDLASKERTVHGKGSHPSWSPDGARLVFERDGGLVIRRLVDGKERELVASGSHPCWSWE